jgi:hypothetical protein
MSRDGLAAATRFLVSVLSALYTLAAIAGLMLVDFDSTRDLVLWTVRLPTGTASAALVSLGAVLGGLTVFWTLLVPLAVAAVIACSVRLARRPATLA